MEKALKSNEWQKIWVFQMFNIEIQKEGPSNSVVLQNWFSQEIRSPSLILLNFEKLTKGLLTHVECIQI